MNKAKHPSEMPADISASVTAESVRSDFSGLIELFDRHLLAVDARDDMAQHHLVKAKAAAERGLLLSQRLIDLITGSK